MQQIHHISAHCFSFLVMLCFIFCLQASPSQRCRRNRPCWTHVRAIRLGNPKVLYAPESLSSVRISLLFISTVEPPLVREYNTRQIIFSLRVTSVLRRHPLSLSLYSAWAPSLYIFYTCCKQWSIMQQVSNKNPS